MSTKISSKTIKKEKIFICDNGWCRKSFATKFSMQRHQKGCGVDPVRVQCEKCKKSLKSTKILEKHQIICYGLAKKVLCQLCDELFCSQFSLRRHLFRFHQNEKWSTETIIKQENYPKSEEVLQFNQSTDKRILNFSCAKIHSDYKNDFHYYMDVYDNYEFLDGEVDVTKFDKPAIYRLTEIENERNTKT